jgi:hypothetical protein
MPRPKKVVSVENLEESVLQTTEEVVEEVVEEVILSEKTEENPPEQILIPHHIRAAKMKDDDEVEDEFPIQMTMNVSDPIPAEETQEVAFTKFGVYSNGEYIETVDDQSTDLFAYLELNRAELDSRIHELWQTPNDPNDLIFFNFGQQRMNYNSYYAYFNQNGFAPIEPNIKSWMEYYLNLHNPITPEEIAIQLKGPLQYSFIPIKS